METPRHQRRIEAYLAEEFGCPRDEVHREPAELEHVISDEPGNRILVLLSYPEMDLIAPPTRDGSNSPNR